MRAVQFTVLLALVPVLYAQCATDNTLASEPSDELYLGQQKFTLKMLKALQDATPNESIFFSPHSTYHALLLAYFGAENKTQESLESALSLNWAKSKEDVTRAYVFDHQRRLTNAVNRSVDFNSVDKIFVAEQHKVK